MSGWLGATYDWVKAAHLIFVIFWMAGLFILPRHLIYHQEALAAGRRDEAALWVERETKLRRVILSPAMIVVWALGIALALNAGIADGAPGLGWLHAKIAIVVLLSGYHGWMVGYAKKLGRGITTLTGRQLRLANEVPGVAVVLIVILVIVKPML